jgi:hypothetical protein
LLCTCDHSEPYVFPPTTSGPSSNGPDILLTFNTDQDYWPTWTEDGTGIMYAFVDASQPTAASYGHRCMGVMPAAGGMRTWQWCDNRGALGDSLSSFPAFALGSDGRLLYVESTATRQFAFVPGETALWLADSAHPFRRRKLTAFPTVVGDSTVTWPADLAWTGPKAFIGLGQRYVPASHCVNTMNCSALDTVFYGETIFRGAISPDGATLTPIGGTAGATSYAFAANGSTIVFTKRNSTQLFSLPSTGGNPAVAATVTLAPGVQLFGLSCKGMTCVVATGPVTPWAAAVPGPGVDIARINLGAAELRAVSLVTGESTVLLTRTTGLLMSPLVSATTGDVVAQLGFMMGHLQTFDSVKSTCICTRRCFGKRRRVSNPPHPFNPSHLLTHPE